jgi:hypothetical protein
MLTRAPSGRAGGGQARRGRGRPRWWPLRGLPVRFPGGCSSWGFRMWPVEGAASTRVGASRPWMAWPVAEGFPEVSGTAGGPRDRERGAYLAPVREPGGLGRPLQTWRPVHWGNGGRAPRRRLEVQRSRHASSRSLCADPLGLDRLPVSFAASVQISGATWFSVDSGIREGLCCPRKAARCARGSWGSPERGIRSWRAGVHGQWRAPAPHCRARPAASILLRAERATALRGWACRR